MPQIAELAATQEKATSHTDKDSKKLDLSNKTKQTIKSPRKPSVRAWLLVGLIGGVLLLAVGGGFFVWSRYSAARPIPESAWLAFDFPLTRVHVRLPGIPRIGLEQRPEPGSRIIQFSSRLPEGYDFSVEINEYPIGKTISLEETFQVCKTELLARVKGSEKQSGAIQSGGFKGCEAVIVAGDGTVHYLRLFLDDQTRSTRLYLLIAAGPSATIAKEAGIFFDSLEIKQPDANLLKSPNNLDTLTRPLVAPPPPPEVFQGPTDQGELVIQMRPMPDYGSTIALSPDGRRLAYIGLDKKLRLLNVDRRTVECVVSQEQANCPCLAFSADGKMLAAGYNPFGIVCFTIPADPTKEQPVALPIAKTASLSSLHFNPDGSQLIWYAEQKIYRFDLATKQQLPDLALSVTPIWYMSFSPKMDLAAAVLASKYIQIVDLSTGKPREMISEWQIGGENIHSMLFVRNGKSLVYGTFNPQTQISSLMHWQLDKKTPSILRSGIKRLAPMATNPSGSYLGVHTPQGTQIWDMDTIKQILWFPAQGKQVGADPDEQTFRLSFSADGSRLAEMTSKRIRVWDLVKAAKVEAFQPK